MDTAIILAGGLGTRLRPITYEIPKPLLPVHGKTLTEHVFDILKKAGIEQVILSVGYMSDKVQEYYGAGERFGLKISYAIEEKPRGTAGPLFLIPKLKNTFILLNGDDLFNIDFKKMYASHKRNNALATIALTKVEDPTKYGVVRMEGDRIIDFIEKPKKEEVPSNMISSGYYLLEPEVFDLVPKNSDFAMIEKDIFPILATKGKLFGYYDPG
ncbi:nucleotidyltransferase family protein, partial [Candidatus Woesearchaeota archaeon]|nr:nucleotidyltransferase family protein [Candidatus Woesearchaeota archaeon]